MINVMTADEQIISLEVDPQESVENVKALLEVKSGMCRRGGRFSSSSYCNHGREVRNSDRLSALGIKDEDLLMMVSGAPTSAATNDMGLNPDGSAVNPAALQQQLWWDSNLIAQLFQQYHGLPSNVGDGFTLLHLMGILFIPWSYCQNDPEFAQAIVGNDLNRLQEILRARHRQRSELQRQQEEELALLHAEPFHVKAQRKIEEAIRQKGIVEIWAATLEYNPEAFARVAMLYVDMEVNSVPLKIAETVRSALQRHCSWGQSV